MPRLLAALKGMVTAPGGLVRDPESLQQADNVLFDLPGVVRTRPGWKRNAMTSGGPIWAMFSGPDTNTCLSGNNILFHMGSASASTNLKYGTGVGSSTTLTAIDGVAVGAPSAADQRRSVFAMGSACIYMGRSDVTRRIESAADGVRYAGMPRGLPLGTGSVFAAGTYLVNNSNVAYRVTWHRKAGSLSMELGGAPTGRFVIRNTSGATKDVVCRILLPKEFGTTATALTTSYYYRLWRSRTAASSEPDDEMFLVAEAFVTAGNIAAGYVDVTDSTTDSVLASAPPLHTNTNFISLGDTNTVQGPLNGDEPPPRRVNALAMWNDVMWYGAVNSSFGECSNTLLVNLANNDTVRVDGVTYTAKAAPGALPEFQLGATIELTCLSLCDAINRYATNTTCYAYYVSQGTQLPGAIRFIARNAAGISMDGPVGGTKWRKDVSTVALSSEASLLSGTIYYSKSQRPDAVPAQNQLNLDSSGTILALVPFRQRLLVFTDIGIYQVTGDNYASFALTPFDLTYRLIGPHLVAVCDDKVYAWCSEGIVEIDAGGATVVSHQVEPTLRDIVASETLANMSYGGFAVGYRLKHQVMFFYPYSYNNSTNAQSLFWMNFDTRTRAWSRGWFGTLTGASLTLEGRSCGCVRYSDDMGVLGNWNSGGTDAYLHLEQPESVGASDTLLDGAAHPVPSILKFNFQVPSPVGSVLLRDLWLHWWVRDYRDGGYESWRPATIELTESSGLGSATDTLSTTLATSDNITRRLVGKDARRGQRYQITLVHNINGESFGLQGVGLDFVDDGAKGKVAV